MRFICASILDANASICARARTSEEAPEAGTGTGLGGTGGSTGRVSAEGSTGRVGAGTVASPEGLWFVLRSIPADASSVGVARATRAAFAASSSGGTSPPPSRRRTRRRTPPRRFSRRRRRAPNLGGPWSPPRQSTPVPTSVRARRDRTSVGPSRTSNPPPNAARPSGATNTSAARAFAPRLGARASKGDAKPHRTPAPPPRRPSRGTAPPPRPPRVRPAGRLRGRRRRRARWTVRWTVQARFRARVDDPRVGLRRRPAKRRPLCAEKRRESAATPPRAPPPRGPRETREARRSRSRSQSRSRSRSRSRWSQTRRRRRRQCGGRRRALHIGDASRRRRGATSVVVTACTSDVSVPRASKRNTPGMTSPYVTGKSSGTAAATASAASHGSSAKCILARPRGDGGCCPARGRPHMRYLGDPARTGATLAFPVGSSPSAPRVGIAAHPPEVSRTTRSPSRSTTTISTTARHRASRTRVV